MKPIVRIIDTIQEGNNVSVREKTVALFGIVIHKQVECYPIQKDRAIGFTNGGTSLTYIEDE